MFPITLSQIGIAVVVFYITRTIQRFYFHPLSKYPGNPWAITSRMYEVYWEMFRGGKFFERIKEMHERYGPIVRINHFELHINDPECYDDIYNFNPDLDKRRYGFDNLQMAPDFNVHKKRRKVFDPFFSRQSIQTYEPVVQDAVAKVCELLCKSKLDGTPLEISLVYRCMTCEIISNCLLSWQYGFLDKLEDGRKFLEAFHFNLVWMMREIPGVWPGLNALLSVLEVFGNENISVIWRKALREQVKLLEKDDSKTIPNTDKPPGMKVLQTAGIPTEERTTDMQMTNAILFVTAGFETTGQALSTAHYHILSNPKILKRLKTELVEAWPNAEEQMSWNELEKLPYLHACIQESLRISVGVMARLSRVNHKADMRLKDWIIPRGTPFSMSQPFIMFNPSIFEDPWDFRPERWLDPDKAKYLERFLVPFSKGARGCIGKTLASLELYVAMATIFRRFETELVDTKRENVDVARDFFVPYPETGGQRVMIKTVR